MIEALKEGRYMTMDDLEAEFGWSVHLPNRKCRCGAKLEMRRGVMSCPACRKKVIAKIKEKYEIF